MLASSWYAKNARFWYGEFRAAVGAGECSVGGAAVALQGGAVPPQHFYACLAQWTAAHPEWRGVRVQGGAVTRATSSFTAKKILIDSDFNKNAIQLMRDTQALAAAAPAHTFAFEQEFLNYEADAVLADEATFTLLGSFACIFCVMLLVFGDVFATLLVLGAVLCVVLVTAGSIWFWGLYFNTVTVVHLFMSVGISVDYCAHIMHEFKGARGTHPERARQALVKMAPAVTHAIISTFLAIALTAMSKN